MKLLLAVVLYSYWPASHDEKALVEAAQHSEVVVVAEVVNVDASPEYWSGVLDLVCYSLVVRLSSFSFLILSRP